MDNTGAASSTVPFKAVIFDMDGTLLESTEADFKAWEKVFEHYNQSLTYDKYVTMLGIRSADVIQNFLGFHDKDDVARILIEKFDRFVDYVNEHPIKPMKAAEDFLKSLAQYDVKLAIATSSRKEKTQLILGQLNFLQYFDAIVTGEEVTNSKPAPDIFLKAAERLNVAPQHCVVIEDGPLGVTAAKKAGMKCIAITATHPADKLREADYVMETYEGAEFAALCKMIAVNSEQ